MHSNFLIAYGICSINKTIRSQCTPEKIIKRQLGYLVLSKLFVLNSGGLHIGKPTHAILLPIHTLTKRVLEQIKAA